MGGTVSCRRKILNSKRRSNKTIKSQSDFNFCSGWDHSIRNKNTAYLQHCAIKAQIEEKLILDRNKHKKWRNIWINILSWFLCLLILGLLSYFLWWTGGQEVELLDYSSLCRTKSKAGCDRNEQTTFLLPLGLIQNL